jgi:hypothetical protein
MLTGLAACTHTANGTSASAGAIATPTASAIPARASQAPSTPGSARASSAPQAAPPAGPATGAPVSTVAPAATGAPAAASATPAGPQILSLSVTPSVVHAGGSVAFAARTTPDIANVTAFVSAYTLPFTRTSAGRFSLAFAIPASVPGVFHGTYTMNVVARSANGASASRSIAVTFQ